MPVVFLQGDYKIVEEIAKEDIAAANQLRSVIRSIRNNLEKTIEKNRLSAEFMGYAWAVVDEVMGRGSGLTIDEEFDFGKISEHHAEMLRNEIKNATGKDIDFSGYRIKIKKETIEHIWRRHGINGKANSSMSTPEDLESCLGCSTMFRQLIYQNIKMGMLNLAVVIKIPIVLVRLWFCLILRLGKRIILFPK